MEKQEIIQILQNELEYLDDCMAYEGHTDYLSGMYNWISWIIQLIQSNDCDSLRAVANTSLYQCDTGYEQEIIETVREYVQSQ